MLPARAILLVIAGALSATFAAWIGWQRADRAAAATNEFVVYSDSAPVCAVIVPAQPSDAELRAARLMSETLTRAAGRTAFPVLRETGAGEARGIFVGETRRGADAVPRVRRQAPFDDVFSLRVEPGAAFLRSARPEAIEIAAGWFLEQQPGAHWFMPGPLGVHVPPRTELKLIVGEAWVRPAFLSRALGEGGAWAAANKLEARIEHGHSYARIFTRDDLLNDPQFAPIRAGARFVPAKDGLQGWQPDLTAPAAVAHAAQFINRVFDREPARSSFPLCQNDSVRYDESATTLAQVSPPRYFRHQPDYTPLVFKFTNAVADLVRAQHPDRWIAAYAYDWTENAPDFRIAPNVVPFLTADRNQWFEPAFAAEDRGLIARWVKSGARIVGTYDYFEGAPFLVPRPTLYAVAESIPYEYAVGVRAFYGEGAPNWGLDGPKAWLAAQLLWDPRRSPTELLDIYYREFWQEAAAPMRAFFDCAELAWREQPRPGYWIKYYLDEHQTLLFPPALREAMRGRLADAGRVARSDLVRARVAFVRGAFAVTGAFADFCEARDALTRGVANPATDEGELSRLLHAERAVRTRFLKSHADLRRVQPIAIQTDKLDFYLRNDPAGATRLRLSQSARGRSLLAADKLAGVTPAGPELLQDATWQTIEIGEIGGSTSFEWAGSPTVGAWRGHGDPYEDRRISLGAGEADARSVRFAGCKQEALSQIRDGARPGQTYVARARVRARVSPGNATFLILTFFDEDFQPFALGRTCRLPAGEQNEWAELAVVATAPPKTRYVGLGVRVLNQVRTDFAEFAGASLRCADER